MPRELVRAYAVRAAVLWLGLRVFVAAASPFSWSIQGLALAVVATLAIVLVDAEVRNERRFLANLAVGRRRIVMVVVATVATIEVVIGSVVGLVRLA